MRAFRVGLHSLALVAADIAGIAAGALVAFHISAAPNQVWLQLPVAALLSVVCFWAWLASLRILKLRRLLPVGSKALGACLGASILWAPVVFVPLHYVTQGYLTSIGNLIALAFYQLPVNGVALFGPLILQPPISEALPPPEPLGTEGARCDTDDHAR